MKAIRKLTGMGGDVRQIAKLLQAKAPPGHRLAYINDEEAALLKSRGGSGRITESGIPSFEETPIDIGFGPNVFQPSETPAPAPAIEPAPQTVALPSDQVSAAQPQTLGSPGYVAGADRTVDYGGDTPLPTVSGTPTPGYNVALQDTSLYPASGQGYGQATQLTPGQPAISVAEPTISQKPSYFDKTLDYLGQPKTLAALGIGGVQAALGASSVRKAQAEAQAAKQQLQTLAAPYQQQGQQLQAAAQRGELTPANQQVLQAAQAQLAQGAAARGGVGVAQATNQIAILTNQLLANQMNMGIQLQGVGDKIAQGAIQTGIQADQYINNLTSNYAQNIARTVAGAAGIQQAPTYVQAQPV